MNRRSFLERLVGTVVGAQLVPEIPFALTPPPAALDLAAINAVTLRTVLPAVQDTFFHASPLLEYLRAGLPPTARRPIQQELPGVDWWAVEFDEADLETLV